MMIVLTEPPPLPLSYILYTLTTIPHRHLPGFHPSKSVPTPFETRLYTIICWYNNFEDDAPFTLQRLCELLTPYPESSDSNHDSNNSQNADDETALFSALAQNSSKSLSPLLFSSSLLSSLLFSYSLILMIVMTVILTEPPLSLLSNHTLITISLLLTPSLSPSLSLIATFKLLNALDKVVNVEGSHDDGDEDGTFIMHSDEMFANTQQPAPLSEDSDSEDNGDGDGGDGDDGEKERDDDEDEEKDRYAKEENREMEAITDSNGYGGSEGAEGGGQTDKEREGEGVDSTAPGDKRPPPPGVSQLGGGKAQKVEASVYIEQPDQSNIQSSPEL